MSESWALSSQGLLTSLFENVAENKEKHNTLNVTLLEVNSENNGI